MNRTPLALAPAAALLVAALAWHAFAAQPPHPADPIPLPHESSDIPPDPAVTWGVLDNGLRYAVLPNSEPPQRVSMRLYVDAGSLVETDEQQGLAHFLEHMAFNGTKHFPPGEMVEYFQRLGMGFGQHTNAHTTFHETVYKLELPNNTPEMLDEAMKLFRDYADGMLLLPEPIDDERGIILSEKRDRDSVGWRTFVEQMQFVFPEHRISSRMPIGTEEVIRNAPREEFVEFYEHWYTPNRMAVVVVGDIDTETVEEAVRRWFDDMEKRERRPEPPMGRISERGFAAHYHHEPEAGETSVSIDALLPRENPPDNRERRLHDLQLTLASQMINRRLERIARREDSPIRSARMRTGDFFDLGFALHSSIEADCRPGDWEEALSLIEQELRRALEFGFTEGELEEAKANVRRMHEEALQQMNTRRSRSLADQIARRIGNRRIFTSPADDLPRVMESLDAITVESCAETLRNLWEEAPENLVLVSGNLVLEEEEALAAIESVFRESQAAAVAPPLADETAEFAYSDLPGPGAVAERVEVEDLAVTQLRFENEVRANLRPADYEEGVVHIRARIGAGLLTEPEPGLSLLLSTIFTRGGLEAHSDDELKRLFAGESVNVGFSVEDDAFVLSGQTTPAALKQQLTLMRAYITHPGFRPEALAEFRRALDALYQQLERTPGGVSQDKVARFLRGGDERFGYPPRSAAEALTLEQARAWLDPDLSSGHMEVTLVGDFDREEAVELLAATFGNLPERAASKPPYEEERRVSFPPAATKVFRFESEIPKGSVTVYWPTTHIYDIERSRRLGMLSAVLSDRLRVTIREELGDAYSPFAHNIPSDTWTDYGYLFAAVTVDPEQAEDLVEVVSGIAAELATGESVTDDELERAKLPQITQIEEMRRTNRYWMGSVLESSQEYPQRLDWARTFVDDYRNITVEEINALAAEFLTADTQVNVIVTPVAAGGGGAD